MSYKDRVGRFSDDIDRYAKGEINAAQGLLRLFGEGAGLANDAIGAITEPLIPEFVAEGIQHIAQAAMETGPAKKTLQWMKENPEQARDITAAVNIGSLMGFKGVGNTAKGVVKSAAHNAPNNLGNTFYGSGILGQGYAAAKAVPSTAYHTTKDLLTPKGQARLDAGVSSRLKKVANTEEPDFLLGQIEQSSQLAHGANQAVPVLDDIYRPVGELSAGPFGPAQMRKNTELYKPTQYGPDMGPMVDTATQRVGNTWRSKFKDAPADADNAVMINRHPTALSDITVEPFGGKQTSYTGRSLFQGKKLMGKYFPDKDGFASMDELMDFAALKHLNDRTMVKKVKVGENARGNIYEYKDLTKADRKRLKLVGEKKLRKDPKTGEREALYVPKDQGWTNVENYFKFKSKLEKGEKLTPAQLKKYTTLKDRLSKAKKQMLDSGHMRVDGDRVWIADSHRSGVKSLGGVNDQYSIDLKGNMTDFISDETDLFGLVPPGHKRMINTHPPTQLNVFKTLKNPTDTAGKKAREAHRSFLEEAYGAADRGGKRNQMVEQIGEAITNWQPRPTLQNYKDATRNVGHTGLLLTQGLLNEFEDL